MSTILGGTSTAPISPSSPGIRIRRDPTAPKRSAPFGQEPGYYEPAGLWFYGNMKLLEADVATVELALGAPGHSRQDLAIVEGQAEKLVLANKVLVCGIHSPAQQTAAGVPLRWGSPRILVVSGGFKQHLGPDLKEEPFRAARLWRYQWDPVTDLIVSRRAPDRMPTFARHNPTVDRMILALSRKEWPGLELLSQRSPIYLD